MVLLVGLGVVVLLVGLGVVVLLRRLVRSGSKFRTAAVVESVVRTGTLSTVDVILGRERVVVDVVVVVVVVVVEEVVDLNLSG